MLSRNAVLDCEIYPSGLDTDCVVSGATKQLVHCRASAFLGRCWHGSRSKTTGRGGPCSCPCTLSMLPCSCQGSYLSSGRALCLGECTVLLVCHNSNTIIITICPNNSNMLQVFQLIVRYPLGVSCLSLLVLVLPSCSKLVSSDLDHIAAVATQ